MRPLAVKGVDVKVVRRLASEITQRGATLYDGLEKEAETRDARQRAVNRNMVRDSASTTPCYSNEDHSACCLRVVKELSTDLVPSHA